jgi:hypothetical protein
MVTTTNMAFHGSLLQRLSYLERSMNIILQDEVLLLDMTQQPYASNVHQSTTNLHCRIRLQDTIGCLPMQYLCLYSIAFQILELDMSLDRHIPRHTIDATIVGCNMDRIGALREELRLQMVYYYYLCSIIKFCLSRPQFPRVSSLCLLDQMQILDTHIWLLSFTLLDVRLYYLCSA